MLKKCQIIFFLILACSTRIFLLASTPEFAEWTILTYMQAGSDVGYWANYSLSHMVAGMQNNKGVNVLAQWDHLDKNMLTRYKVVVDDFIQVDSIPKNIKDGSQVAEIVEAMSWAHTNYPAKHYMLVFWDHGHGILDYTYNQYMYSEETKARHPYWLKGRGKRSYKKDLKGLMIEDNRRYIMTNQDLQETMRQIYQKVGRKIDIVGMDACFMGMMEVGYQIKDYANYLFASQEWTTGEGLPYGLFLYPLTLNYGCLTPGEFAKTMVTMSGLFYKDKEGGEFTTYSSLDLNKMKDIKENIKQLVKEVEECKKHNPSDIKKIIQEARQTTHGMFWKCYMDMYDFYNQLYVRVIQKNMDPARSTMIEYQNALDHLKKTLLDGMLLIKSVIVANVAIKNHKEATGMSMYFPMPEDQREESYEKTLFINDCPEWLRFIQEYKA
jgi:hypothetical protein